MDTFSDDGFDDLNDDLLQLEDNVIHFTSHAQQQTISDVGRVNNQPQNGVVGAQLDQKDWPMDYAFEDDDIDDADVINELKKKIDRPVEIPHAPAPVPQSHVIIPTLAGQQRWNQQQQQQQQRTAWGTNLNTAAGNSVGKAGTHGSQSIRSQYPPLSRPMAPPNRIPPRHIPQLNSRPPLPPSSQFSRPCPTPSVPPRATPSQSSQYDGHNNAGGNQHDLMAVLKSRLADLEGDLLTARGEASFLRGKLKTAQDDHLAEVSRLKQVNTDQQAKQERAVESALAAHRSAATELEFTRQDLREELGRAKSKKKDVATTPKKNRSFVADGFDDVEILPSPSKLAALRRRDTGPVAVPVAERTPSKGKRKRATIESPVNALEIQSDDIVMREGPGGASSSTIFAGRPPAVGFQALPFDVSLVLFCAPF
jgi:hypothetical protein